MSGARPCSMKLSQQPGAGFPVADTACENPDLDSGSPVCSGNSIAFVGHGRPRPPGLVREPQKLRNVG